MRPRFLAWGWTQNKDLDWPRSLSPVCGITMLPYLRSASFEIIRRSVWSGRWEESRRVKNLFILSSATFFLVQRATIRHFSESVWKYFEHLERVLDLYFIERFETFFETTKIPIDSNEIWNFKKKSSKPLKLFKLNYLKLWKGNKFRKILKNKSS